MGLYGGPEAGQVARVGLGHHKCLWYWSANGNTPRRKALFDQEIIRAIESPGGTSIQAGTTGQTVVGHNLIRLQIEVREETREHQERTQLRIDQQIILPYPA